MHGLEHVVVNVLKFFVFCVCARVYRCRMSQ